jgi:hypothetical protein
LPPCRCPALRSLVSPALIGLDLTKGWKEAKQAATRNKHSSQIYGWVPPPCSNGIRTWSKGRDLFASSRPILRNKMSNGGLGLPAARFRFTPFAGDVAGEAFARALNRLAGGGWADAPR